MESLVSAAFWRGKKVFLTGHTGFKGSWLALWLNGLGARVSGYALAPATHPNLFATARVGELVHSHLGDLRDAHGLAEAMAAADPDIIFHLAAQPLVGESYRDPAGTYATNVMGTVHLLEAARRQPRLRAAVIVTSDKCYDNRGTGQAFRESDPLGGDDPYSSSKACVEILAHSWRRSFFAGPDAPGLATARAGNVIGGGDWSPDRLVPDLLRAFAAGETAELRRPAGVRPWQHVLEPLYGYLQLAQRLYEDSSTAPAWNFGPDLADCVSAGEVADRLAALWPGEARWQAAAGGFPPESALLRLDAGQARRDLGWQPRWPLPEALRRTVAWQRAWLAGEDMQAFCRQQIDDYQNTPCPT